MRETICGSVRETLSNRHAGGAVVLGLCSIWGMLLLAEEFIGRELRSLASLRPTGMRLQA